MGARSKWMQIRGIDIDARTNGTEMRLFRPALHRGLFSARSGRMQVRVARHSMVVSRHEPFISPMTLSMLPKLAFLPRRKLSESERRTFVERRDRLFLLCTPGEQKCLIELARRYGAHRFELLARPNIFTESFSAVFQYRYFPWANSKPNAILRMLAKLSGVFFKVERWSGPRFQSSFITHMRLLVGEGNEDVLMGVVHFFRELPLQIGFDGQRALENKLDAMTSTCVASDHVSASRRFDAVLRCVQWTYGPTGLQRSEQRKLAQVRMAAAAADRAREY